ncbi:acyl-CoA dehydrogenase family protein [Erythrobacter sp. NAP1]|uniref:acyl-CoA dehydrogenase family protein n=1 Tax=Erythrobacter sp. NAP1 TaxID=237727 RepID=UPI0000686AE5|nr:acyl-CoA dehydrogenase family protein [Erythrobacter sp. NAP1]EAQ29140.1 acyl-CoA dehydrogenase family protein [Erythrobacter sp. NAP1]
MDFSYSQEQVMLTDSVARYLEKNYDFDTRKALVASDAPWSADVWGQFAELGLLALPFSEEHGGLGGSISDLVAFTRSFGKHLVVEPYAFAIMLSGAALASSANPKAAEWIERIVSGEAIAAFAYEEGNGTASPGMIATSAGVDTDGFALSGEKRIVIAGGDADVLVVAAKHEASGKLALFLVDANADGLSISPYTTIDGRSAANIRFDDVQIGKDAVLIEDATDTLERIVAQAIIVLSAEALGAMGALLEITADYAMTRKQFGQPIAMFQAIAHRLADMKIAYAKAMSTLTYTTALANSGAATARDIHVLKGQLGKLGREIGESAIQVHGGLGLTDELNVGHYHKRLLAYDAIFGDHDYHLRKLGQR